MPKKILQDIIAPSNNRRNIPRESHNNRSFLQQRKRNTISSKISTPRKRNSRVFLWGIAFFAVFLLVFSFFSLFEKAVIKISPKQEIAVLDSQFSAFKGGEKGLLPFETMVLNDTETVMLPATEIKKIERNASGKIVIYNDFSSSKQRLVKNTRFETTEGLIYRISESTTVPGKYEENGETVPGSVEVIVYADESTEEYNIGLTDFTIPGFKGTPRFKGFFARSKTVMSGGFNGVIKTVSEDELDKARERLKETLRAKLSQDAHAQKPDDFILYDDGIFITFDDIEGVNEEVPIAKDQVVVTLTATLHGIIFNTSLLSNFLAQNLVPNFQTSDSVIISNANDLDFLVHDKELFNPDDDKEISFSIKGKPHIIWEFDEDTLRDVVAGKSKDEFKTFLGQYASIQKAEVILRPFWKDSFPEDPKRIRIEKVIE